MNSCKLVPGDRIELPTRCSSGSRSANELPGENCWRRLSRHHTSNNPSADAAVPLAGHGLAPSDHGFNGFRLHCLAAVTSSRASNLVNRPVLDTAGDSRLAQGRERVLCSGLQRKQSYNIQRIVSTLSFCFSISFFTAFRSPLQNNRRPCFRRCFAHSPEFVRRPRRRLCATVHLNRVAPSQQWYILANALHQLASEDFAALATASLSRQRGPSSRLRQNRNEHLAETVRGHLYCAIPAVAAR